MWREPKTALRFPTPFVRVSCPIETLGFQLFDKPGVIQPKEAEAAR